MKKVSLFLMTLICSLAFISCGDDMFSDDGETPSGGGKPNLITKYGKQDGISYSLKDVSINPGLVVLNDQNADLLSSQDDLSKGILKVNTGLSIVEGSVVYIDINGYVDLKKVLKVKNLGSSYELETEQGQLGEMFETGEIGVSFDFYEISKAAEKNDPSLKSTWVFDLFNFDREYAWGDSFVYNPATNLKIGMHLGMAFNKAQVLPSNFSTYFEVTPTINPLFAFRGTTNQVYSGDLTKMFLASSLVDFIKRQEFAINIPINVLGISFLTTKIKIDDIKIPTTIESNILGESSFTYGINGTYKIGYSVEIDGLKSSWTPIYVNSLKTNVSATANLSGELNTDSDIIITPSISVLNGLYKVSGDFGLGLRTENALYNIGNGKPKSYATKGLLKTKMSMLIDLLLIKIPIDISNREFQLWDVGEVHKEVVYSDLSWGVTSKYHYDALLIARSFETDFKVNYQYATGRMIPDELIISYDVYQDNNSTKIVSKKNMVINPTNVTNRSFSFKLDIPYKSTFISYQTKSYLRNIVIRDRGGYVYEGIYNSANGVNENSFAITR